jgi:hypothetical protein
MQRSVPSPSGVTSNTALRVERRRPGRIASPDAELIPLMRRPRPPEEVLEEVAEKWEPRERVLAIGGIFYQILK